MSTITSAENVMDSTLEAVKLVLPMPMSAMNNEKSSPREEFCIKISFSGGFVGNMLIAGDSPTFGKLGEGMFGMVLENEMLDSFAGELVNMVAGNLCQLISKKGIIVDITPPKLYKGEKVFLEGTNHYLVSLNVQNIGELDIALLVE